MQRTITKRRKKIAKELECSFSAAPFSGSTICSIVSSLVAFCRYKHFYFEFYLFSKISPLSHFMGMSSGGLNFI